jgi:hypothetical protein
MGCHSQSMPCIMQTQQAELGRCIKHCCGTSMLCCGHLPTQLHQMDNATVWSCSSSCCCAPVTPARLDLDRYAICTPIINDSVVYCSTRCAFKPGRMRMPAGVPSSTHLALQRTGAAKPGNGTTPRLASMLPVHLKPRCAFHTACDAPSWTAEAMGDLSASAIWAA